MKIPQTLFMEWLQDVYKMDLGDARVIANRWEPQEEGMMSTAVSFPSVRNQGLSDQ